MLYIKYYVTFIVFITFITTVQNLQEQQRICLILVQLPINNSTMKVPSADRKKKHPNKLCQQNRNNTTTLNNKPL
jgi:hypothetical protein